MSERLWTGNDGKYQVLATFVCLFQDKKVKLKKPNGAMVAVPLTFLCQEDVAFIATQAKPLAQDPASTTNKPQLTSRDSAYTSSSKTETTDDTKLSEEEPADDEIKDTSAKVAALQVSPAANHQNVRQMSQDESKQMTPKRSLSSITDQFKRQTYYQFDHPVPLDTRNLAHLPSKTIIRVASFLDVRSRLQVSLVSRRFHQLIYKPDVWNWIKFRPSDQFMVNDQFVYQLIVFLQLRGGLHSSIRHVDLDGTVITASSVLLLIKYLENIQTLSVQTCWQLYTYSLATQLTHLAKSAPEQYPSKIASVTLGKVLHRGPVDQDNSKGQPGSVLLESKSFGQDAWFMNAALNKLTKQNVAFDVVLCGTCHLGASLQVLHCASCGILPLKKCMGCAPRCDRCGNRSCGLSTCSDPKLKIQMARCGRCELTLALCNDEKSAACQTARKPCTSCHRLYHTRCRAPDGTYMSNQCSSCGDVACPHCELSICSSGCHGQWCKRCLPKVHFGHCRCIIIQGKAETSSKSMSKRSVCGKCQKSCKRCGVDHFCHRCLKVHAAKC